MKEKVNPYRFVRIQMIHALYGDNPPLYIQQELEELQSDNDDIFGNFENTLLHPTGKTDEEIEDYIQMILFKIDLSKTMNISKIKIPKCPTNNKFKINNKNTKK